MKVTKFGKKAEQLRRLYPEAKVLVFTKDNWKLAGAQAVAVNEDYTYVIVKHHTGEYYIIAEKRLGEFISRDSHPDPFKILLAFSGDTLSEMKVENPLAKGPECSSPSQLPVVIYNKISLAYGTGI
jgi:isoleucyl-tRNA synthetase